MSNFCDNYKGGYYVSFVIVFNLLFKTIKTFNRMAPKYYSCNKFVSFKIQKITVNVYISWEEDTSQINLTKPN